jgi:hypothetical protein
VTKLVTVDLDLENRCWEEFNLDLNMVMYDKLKNFGKIVKNSFGPIITDRGNFSFF